MQSATIHDVGHVNYGQNNISYNSGDRQRSNNARSRSGSPPTQEADPPVGLVNPPSSSGCFINTTVQPTSCQIQGATIHDVGHVNYGQNNINHDRSDRETPSSEPAGSLDQEISAHSEPASSPDQEITPSVGSVERYPECLTNVIQSSCYESDDVLRFYYHFFSP